MTFLQFPPLFLLWSALIHFAMLLGVLKLQQRLASGLKSPRGIRYTTISEFLYSVLWVATSLENAIVFSMWSYRSGLAVLGLRLFANPQIFPALFGNPCGAFYSYLCQHPAKRLSTFLRQLCAQFLAIPFGMVIALTVWRVLAAVDGNYAIFWDKKAEYFLSVDPLTGFVVEGGITFCMFLPSIVASRISYNMSSTLYKFVEVAFILCLITQLSAMTGTFMNPIAAFSFYLTWHLRLKGAQDLFQHIFIYFLAPMTGTLMAAGLANLCKKRKDPHQHTE